MVFSFHSVIGRETTPFLFENGFVFKYLINPLECPSSSGYAPLRWACADADTYTHTNVIILYIYEHVVRLLPPLHVTL